VPRLFGTFVTLGDELRYAITGALFDFQKKFAHGAELTG
jgi:hypothetical protein